MEGETASVEPRVVKQVLPALLVFKADGKRSLRPAVWDVVRTPAKDTRSFPGNPPPEYLFFLGKNAWARQDPRIGASGLRAPYGLPSTWRVLVDGKMGIESLQ